jgi:hypothetical protein
MMHVPFSLSSICSTIPDRSPYIRFLIRPQLLAASESFQLLSVACKT